MDKSRQQFEEWSDGKDLYNISPFDIWKASRESLEVELPDKYTLEYMQDDLSDSECDFFKCDDIKNELSNNGVKIKDE